MGARGTSPPGERLVFARALVCLPSGSSSIREIGSARSHSRGLLAVRAVAAAGVVARASVPPSNAARRLPVRMNYSFEAAVSIKACMLSHLRWRHL